MPRVCPRCKGTGNDFGEGLGAAIAAAFAPVGEGVCKLCGGRGYIPDLWIDVRLRGAILICHRCKRPILECQCR